jgi:hypothetical protein
MSSDWDTKLGDLLGAYFCDWSLEEGVAQLVFVSQDHPDYHQQFQRTLETGLEAAKLHDTRALTAVNRYCFARDIDDARDFLQRILDEYQRQYTRATAGTGADSMDTPAPDGDQR